LALTSNNGMRVVELLFAGTSLDKARRIFERTTKHRPRIRLTIRPGPSRCSDPCDE